MKLNKMIYPLALALVVTLGTTGCHAHKPGKITALPDGGAQVGEPGGGGTLTPGMPIEPGGGVQSQIPPGGGQQADNANDIINGMIADRLALAKDTVYFAYDSSAIRKSERDNLAAVAAALSGNPSQKLLIEGNCDERGTEEYNRSLGERRALAAREALAKLGVDPMHIFTRSYGKDKPADQGHDDAAWQKNRRDDFVLLLPKAGS